jgi:hypothetical protein
VNRPTSQDRSERGVRDGLEISKEAVPHARTSWQAQIQARAVDQRQMQSTPLQVVPPCIFTPMKRLREATEAGRKEQALQGNRRLELRRNQRLCSTANDGVLTLPHIAGPTDWILLRGAGSGCHLWIGTQMRHHAVPASVPSSSMSHKTYHSDFQTKGLHPLQSLIPAHLSPDRAHPEFMHGRNRGCAKSCKGKR